MAISDTIESMYENTENAYDKVQEKGGTIPANKNLQNLTNAINSLEAVNNISSEYQSFSVTNTLTGCINSNSSATSSEFASYTGTITAIRGYTITGASVSITMGGVNITSTAYNNGVISIPNVTGNIVITISAVQLHNYLEFKGNDSFSLVANVKLWDGIVEFSGDTLYWQTWDGASTLIALNTGDGYKLYLRGVGNSIFSQYPLQDAVFSLTGDATEIECNGNIENLLDCDKVAQGLHPAVGQYCFHALFRRNSKLISIPDLSTCNLTSDVFMQMFAECGNLITVPKLPTTGTLPSYCYNAMFFQCYKIKLSETQEGEYTIPYRIPADGTATDSTYAVYQMFSDTRGTFTGAPTLNTTYYLSNTNRIVPTEES